MSWCYLKTHAACHCLAFIQSKGNCGEGGDCNHDFSFFLASLCFQWSFSFPCKSLSKIRRHTFVDIAGKSTIGTRWKLKVAVEAIM